MLKKLKTLREDELKVDEVFTYDKNKVFVMVVYRPIIKNPFMKKKKKELNDSDYNRLSLDSLISSKNQSFVERVKP